MIQIDYSVNKQVMTRAGATDPIAAYASEYNYAHFTFDSDWDGLNLTVIFNHHLNGRYLVLPDSNAVALIPTEVIAVPGFEVSIFGTDGDAKRITSTIDFVSVLPSGVDAPVYPLPPSPDIYSQILGIAQSVRDDADAGKFDGEKGDKGDPGTSGDEIIPVTDAEIDAMFAGTYDPENPPEPSGGDTYVAMTEDEIDEMFN